MTRTVRRFHEAAGGRTRARVLFLLACVLALDTADVSMIGAIAGKLESALSLSNTQLGLLAAVPSLVAAFATVPAGMLTDRVSRVRLLAASAFLWTGAMVASGLTQSFQSLLLTRMALGAATATAGPAIASLIGDYFPPSERARMYGLVLSGELLGAGFGFVISGELASALGWRAAFFALALPSLVIGWAVWRWLAEPQRGGASQLPVEDATGAASDPPAQDGNRAATRRPPANGRPTADGEPAPRSVVQRSVAKRNVEPRRDLILSRDPGRMSLWSATRYVLRVPTNLVLIPASALGYFYLNGVQTFGLVYVTGRYGVSHSVGTLLLSLLGAGALAGVVAGGRVADRLVASGTIDGRILVGAVGSIAAAVLFLPALLASTLLVAMPLLILSAALFAARNPALDAARLDVMHHRLWGRAEAVRTVLRRLMVATAPLLFGFLADRLASGAASASGGHGFGAGASAFGLRDAFLLLLVTMVIGGALTLAARRTYPADVATALASEDATAGRS